MTKATPEEARRLRSTAASDSWLDFKRVLMRELHIPPYDVLRWKVPQPWVEAYWASREPPEGGA
jgi:hypothetical protein